MESTNRQLVKLLIVGAAASCLVVIGAVAAVAAGTPQSGTLSGSPMTIGGTATTTTPPTVPPTEQAKPTMKAVRPKGF
jgi:hypothetical protein